MRQRRRAVPRRRDRSRARPCSRWYPGTRPSAGSSSSRPTRQLGVAEGDRVAVDEILWRRRRSGIYGYSDMTGDGDVGLWGGYGEYMEIFAGTQAPPDDRSRARPSSSRCSNRWPTRSTGSRPSACNAGDTVVVQGPGHQGLAVLEAVLARKPAAQVIVTGRPHDKLRLDTACTEHRCADAVMVDVDDPVDVVADLTAGRDGRRRDGHRHRRRTTVPMAIDLARAAGGSCSPGSSTSSRVPGLVSDHIVLKSLQLYGGTGFTPESMAAAVGAHRVGGGAHRRRRRRGVRPRRHRRRHGAAARTAPGRDAVRVGLRHSHDSRA